ncbi:hypothetical protein HZB60_05720 [candidate division KSB1 bacterium]|nr:hypothetical protein [candidate division KSB1 bacterium]
MTGFPAVPASAFLLDHLLGLLFILHVLFMNYVLIAPFVIAWFLIAKGNRGRLRARWMSAALPVAYTFAINLGVACLLFVQVLFPGKFFTANILIGSAWLGVIGLLLASFYGVYLVKLWIENERVHAIWPGLLSLAVGLLVVGIGLTMIANYFVTTTEASWPDYQTNASLVLKARTLLPRSLHYLLGAMAITGFWMVWIAGWRSRLVADAGELDKLRRQGLLIAAGATAGQVVIGIWYLLSLEPVYWDKLFSGGFASIVWISGVAAGLILLVVLIVANFIPQQRQWQRIASVLLAWTLVGMVSGRELIRITSFGADFDLRGLPSQTQQGPMLMFSWLLLGALAILAGLLFVVLRAVRQTAANAGTSTGADIPASPEN